MGALQFVFRESYNIAITKFQSCLVINFIAILLSKIEMSNVNVFFLLNQHLKGVVHPINENLLSFTYPCVVPNLYDFFILLN